MSNRPISIPPKTLEPIYKNGTFDILPRSRKKRPGSLSISSFKPVKRRQSVCVQPFRRSPSPKKYRISSSLWSPYGEEQSTAHLFSPSKVSFTESVNSAPRDWNDQPSPLGKMSWEENRKTRAQCPGYQVIVLNWECYNGANGESLRSHTDGDNNDIPSSYAGNQAGTISNTLSSVTASNTPGRTELGGCGHGDDDDPRKHSKTCLKSTHDDSDSSLVPSDESEEEREKIAVRKGKRWISSNYVPLLDRDLSEEDNGKLDEIYDPVRIVALKNQAAAGDFPPLRNSPSSNEPEASQHGQTPSIAFLADNTAASDGVPIDTEPTSTWLGDRLDTLHAIPPARAYIDDNERPRRHSISTRTIEQPADIAEPGRRLSMLERHLEYGLSPTGTPYLRIALDGAGHQSDMPTLVNMDWASSDASDSPSRDAAFSSTPGHRSHSAGRPSSDSVDQNDNGTTTTGNHRGRSRLSGLPTSHTNVCEESQSRRGWRSSEPVPASVITEEQSPHAPWIAKKRPFFYLGRSINARVGYGPSPNIPRSSHSRGPCDQIQGDKAQAAEETTVTSNTAAEPTTVTSNIHTPASAAVMTDSDDIPTEHFEQALSPDPNVAATADVPRYQPQGPPRDQLQEYSSPICADAQLVDGTQEALVGTLSQVASQTRESDSGPDVDLRNTQVMDFVDFVRDVSRNLRENALPPVNRVALDSDESWGAGIPHAEVVDVELVRGSFQTDSGAHPSVVMNSEAPRPSCSELATLGSEITETCHDGRASASATGANTTGPHPSSSGLATLGSGMTATDPDGRHSAPATGVNTTAPDSTDPEDTQNADGPHRRHAFTNTVNPRRSIISYLLPCLKTNDAETSRSFSRDWGRQNDRRIFGSASTTNDPARPPIYESQRNRSPLRSSDPTPEAGIFGGVNDVAHDASTDPSTTGPWLTP